MDDTNLTLVPLEELPQTEEKKEKIRVNNLQENFIFLIEQKKVSLADVCRETSIPMTTAWGWFTGSVDSQLLNINVKELADYFEVEIGALAFDDMRGIDRLKKEAKINDGHNNKRL